MKIKTFKEFLNEGDLGQRFGQSIGAGLGGALGGGIGAVPGALLGRGVGWLGDKLLGKGSATQLQPLVAQVTNSINNLNNAVSKTNSNDPNSAKLTQFVGKMKQYSDQLSNSKVIASMDQNASQQVQQDKAKVDL